ncbi:MAG: C_GCAxxG_C_C family protein [Bacteroidales bacterium]|nr:C_GCAxxG_C_C family protein [Bacteroidales bacterium]
MASKVIKLPEGFSPEGRGDLAKSFFLQGYNCCQAVLLAFADILEADGTCDRKTLAILGSGFGGGMARMREVCGSFSACVIMAGFISPADDAEKEKRAANYALVQDMAEEFKSLNGGSIVCGELLGLKERRMESPVPSERTPEYYAKRPCPEIIRNAAIIVARRLESY